MKVSLVYWPSPWFDLWPGSFGYLGVHLRGENEQCWVRTGDVDFARKLEPFCHLDNCQDLQTETKLLHQRVTANARVHRWHAPMPQNLKKSFLNRSLLFFLFAFYGLFKRMVYHTSGWTLLVLVFFERSEEGQGSMNQVFLWVNTVFGGFHKVLKVLHLLMCHKRLLNGIRNVISETVKENRKKINSLQL